jgi:hypothetical protein
MINQKTYTFGVHKTKEEAMIAIRAGRQQLHKTFSCDG